MQAFTVDSDFGDVQFVILGLMDSLDSCRVKSSQRYCSQSNRISVTTVGTIEKNNDDDFFPSTVFLVAVAVAADRGVSAASWLLTPVPVPVPRVGTPVSPPAFWKWREPEDEASALWSWPVVVVARRVLRTTWIFLEICPGC